MKPEDHEMLVLQMLKEVKAHGFFVSGLRNHTEFLLNNKLIKRTQLFESSRSQSVRVRYIVTDHGEGMLRHLINRYETKESQNARNENST